MSISNFKATLWQLANQRIHPLRPVQSVAEWIMTRVMDWASSFDTPGLVSQDLLDEIHRSAQDPDPLNPFKIDREFDRF
jgi:hypothetical protein